MASCSSTCATATVWPGGLRPGTGQSFQTAESVRNEFLPGRSPCPSASAGTTNANLASGEIEVLCHDEVLNPSVTPPFQLDEETSSRSASPIASSMPSPDAEQPDAALQDGAPSGRFLDDNAASSMSEIDAHQVHTGRRPDYLVPSRIFSKAILRVATIAAALQTSS